MFRLFIRMNKQTWQLRKLEFGSHTATHVDAFSHMHAQLETLDDIPLDRFCGEAQVVMPDDKWPKHIGLLFQTKINMSFLEKIVEANPNFVGGEITEELERALLKHRIITYTNLTQLEKLPIATSFQFYGFPLRIKGGDGSPVRAVAMIE